MNYDVIIIGAGPAGLTAGMYTSRANLNTLIIEKALLGGELLNRELIENYPGYPDGIMGPELGSNMVNQAMNYRARIELDEVMQIRVEEEYKVVQTAQTEYRTKAIIIAGGAHPRKLAVPGEEEFLGRGVFYCATCDGPMYASKIVAVAGGGDLGLTDALILTRMLTKVIIIEQLPQLTATKILQDRCSESPKVEIRCGAKIEAINGKEQVEVIDILDVQNGQRNSLPVNGVLVHIGIEANTEYLKDAVPLNDRGQIIVNERMETKVTGVLAAGDIRSNSLCQVSTAVGDGATAALSIIRQLGNH